MPTASADTAILLHLTVRIPAAGVSEFRAYEDRVLPLLAEHGGTLERRLRSADGTVEVHIVHFASQENYGRFRNDPRRATAAHLMAASGAVVELIEMHNV